MIRLNNNIRVRPITSTINNYNQLCIKPYQHYVFNSITTITTTNRTRIHNNTVRTISTYTKNYSNTNNNSSSILNTKYITISTVICIAVYSIYDYYTSNLSNNSDELQSNTISLLSSNNKYICDIDESNNTKTTGKKAKSIISDAEQQSLQQVEQQHKTDTTAQGKPTQPITKEGTQSLAYISKDDQYKSHIHEHEKIDKLPIEKAILLPAPQGKLILTLTLTT